MRPSSRASVMGCLFILKVEYEVVESLADFAGTIILARLESLFQLMDQRAHFVGVLVGGLGEQSAGFGECLFGLRALLLDKEFVACRDRRQSSVAK